MNRRGEERRFVPARLIGRDGVEGRVLDASPGGVLVEIAAKDPVLLDALSVAPAKLTGAFGDTGIRLRPRWWIPLGDRVRVGAEADASLHAWLDRQTRAYDDVNRIERERAVTREDLIALASHELQTASELEVSMIDRYEQLGERSRFLWGWVLAGADLVELPGGEPRHRRRARSAKLLLAILDAVVDDVADGGAAHLEVLRLWNGITGETPLDDVPAIFRDIARLAQPMWRQLWQLLFDLPNFHSLRDYLRHDLEQVGQAMAYAALTNRMPEGAHDYENRIYQAHNMVMIAFGTIDLMARDFDLIELGLLRELLARGQEMGRIGNAVTTWEREVGEGDFSSRFFTRLAELSGIPVAQLAELPQQEIELLEAHHHATHDLLREWRDLRNRARHLATRVRSLPAHHYVDGLEQFLSYHLSSRGLK